MFSRSLFRRELPLLLVDNLDVYVSAVVELSELLICLTAQPEVFGK